MGFRRRLKLLRRLWLRSEVELSDEIWVGAAKVVLQRLKPSRSGRGVMSWLKP
jgi:hypothetical protein